jgi:hypothetical protein
MNHPAVRAWRKLGPNHIKPEAIINLKKRRRRKRGKSAVYRLVSVGPAGTCVVAKRCKRNIAVTEKQIYEEVLPHLPISTLRYYGYIKDYEQEYDWLFLEDAGDIKYSSSNGFHRIAATKWLATLHATAKNFIANIELKDRGPKYYLNHLRSASNKILINLACRKLNSKDIASIEAVLVHCEIIESNWHVIEDFCDGLPLTLVHGDFNSKNFRVRVSNTGVNFLAFDWETGGCAVPAADLSFLSKLDFDLYWSIVREYWPGLDIQTLKALINFGCIFRALAAIDWASGSFSDNSIWVQRIMENIRIYDSQLTKATRAVGWEI